ncbi:MAG: oligosaccharide flippase family protein, partial [archaeon]
MSKEKGKKQIVSGGGAVFLTMLISYILVFISKLIIARKLDPDFMGLFEMTFTILGIGFIIGGFGLNQSLIRFIPLYKNQKPLQKGVFKFIITIQLITSILVAILLFFSAKQITSFFSFSPIFTDFIKIIAITVPLRIFSNTLSSFLTSKKKIFISKLGRDVIFRVTLIIGIILTIFFKLPPITIILFILISQAITLLYYISKTKNLFIKTSQKPEFEIKRWIFYSTPLLLAGITGYILNWTDNLVIGKFLTETELGVYSIAFSVAFYLFMGSKLFSSIFL